ncbi:hypothetical protein CHELA1G11_13686 [Hyphomicrobiales bacterium]|nr:hypothetical protein CHELA1G2_10628 [Hyphomicrobiales bacterium]CAH1673330.1 hypothetical protein CHELA1G11_13686 [Hyphomicrobiales bacterium]
MKAFSAFWVSRSLKGGDNALKHATSNNTQIAVISTFVGANLREGEMSIFKVMVEVDGRNIQCTVKEGVLATIETGTHDNKVRTPECRIALIVGRGDEEPTAWVQISKYTATNSLEVHAEGWIAAGGPGLSTLSSGAVLVGALTEAEGVELQSVAEGKFGTLACCTAYGNGCYVRCCGGCCSDSTRCPNASCCP